MKEKPINLEKAVRFHMHCSKDSFAAFALSGTYTSCQYCESLLNVLYILMKMWVIRCIIKKMCDHIN
ncbi:hypothetical protein ERICI_03583 [Paenibacillus larvae subsp. larvae]|uniref:Uncharacterized protein n=3 Tax=Paenibacillus larvae TaxID=1464 RepID=V9W800_9BACL|nr:hypothetical protein ERIC2_c14101 [Paenibacillus larvae subsp. larvae DSM 25430]ARF66974.1 hypothetical protein B7C51_02900 [Paenibacillus larvae subsp. pulvifaciens]AVF23335.1 hypothetical protein ERICI_03583 [Paenibacillus larvae subsp. larvae]ETK25980.1 hypothetical protein ERIC1_2c01730 [Paenibacillus larvae subsp. larvae DSM 25719]AVF25829.1 hypothetical protein ERICIII_01644 [Paenibacillus larvae subsp. larvae]